MKLVSIIVPIYKVEEYLERCIQSILNQSYPHIEVILVDDGSPDRCPAICDEYARRDSRIKVIHKANGGLSDARNAGLAIANGEAIAFVDSDDWVSTDYVETMLHVMQEKDADIVECNILKSDGNVLLPKAEEQPAIEEYGTIEGLKLLIKDNVFHQYVWNKLYKRKLIDGILFVYGKCNEDEFWTYQVFGKAQKVCKVTSTLYAYFQRPGSIMGQQYSLKRLDAIEGKIERQEYLDCNYPEISVTARENLEGSLIYSGQMSSKYLESREKRQAMKYLSECYSRYYRYGDIKRITNKKQKIWRVMARVSFAGTCRIKNLLKIGF